MRKILLIISFLFVPFFIFAEKPIVKNIQTISGKNQNIILLWTNPQDTEEEISHFLIFRSNQLISDYKQIESLQPIAKLPATSTGYTDTVPDFSEYFYAVIAYTTKPYDLIIPSVNSTTKSVSLQNNFNKKIQKAKKAEKTYPDGTSRDTPLPYLNILEEKQTNLISSETLKEIKPLQKSVKKQSQDLQPYFFEEDLVSPDGGDDFLLFQILKTTFAPKKYEQAITELNIFLGTNISSSTSNRALFYLGQSQYMLGQFEDAVRSFVKLQSIYPDLTQKWIDASLDNL